MEADLSLEEGSEELKKALEWELSLDNSDLRSRAWYHGTIPRPRAEELLKDNGDFLIRDCISRPGDYVLTCKWRNSPLHFVINKVIQQPNTVYEKIQFQFEDDCFDTVPGLVTYYVGNKNPISIASGAVICKPINRTMPLSYYASRYGVSKPELASYSLLESENHRFENPKCSSLANNNVPPALPVKQLYNEQGRYQISNFGNHFSDQNVNHDQPPPKPSRISGASRQQQQLVSSVSSNDSNDIQMNPDHLYHEPVFDAQNTMTTSLTSSHNRKTSGETRYSFLDRSSISNEEAVTTATAITTTFNEEGEDTTLHKMPDLEPISRFNLNDFSTALLPVENKPLEATSLLKVRSLLMSAGPKMLANHLTRVDLDLLRMNREYDMGLGVQSGLELLLLPHGMQLASDLLERTNCLKYFVAMLVLTCGSEAERAQMLHKWIQVAADTKAALGNLFGFTGLMMGMDLPQVSRLKSTWLTLRRIHTESALSFETKLRPTLKAMQECNSPQAPNTSIPYLFSLTTILQKHLEIVTSDTIETPQDIQAPSGLSSTPPKVVNLGLQWEQTTADYGLQLLVSHLENGRKNANEKTFYRRNSEIVLEDAKFDEQLKDVFQTEFHLRFLWGNRGAVVGSQERHTKLEQVLTVMSERCEPNKN